MKTHRNKKNNSRKKPTNIIKQGGGRGPCRRLDAYNFCFSTLVKVLEIRPLPVKNVTNTPDALNFCRRQTPIKIGLRRQTPEKMPKIRPTPNLFHPRL